MQGRFTGLKSVDQALGNLKAEVVQTKPLASAAQTVIGFQTLEWALKQAAEIGVHYAAAAQEAEARAQASLGPSRGELLVDAAKRWLRTAWRPMLGLAALWLGTGLGVQGLMPRADGGMVATGLIALVLAAWVLKPLLVPRERGEQAG